MKKSTRNEKQDCSKQIIENNPNMAPLLTILKANENGKVEACNPKIVWFEGIADSFNSLTKRDDYTEQYNYLEIFRDVITPEYQSMKTKIADFEKCKKEMLKKHLKKISYKFWYGKTEKRTDITADTPYSRETGGILYFLQKNDRMTEIKKDFTDKEFNDCLRPVFEHGNSTKCLFVDCDTYSKLKKKKGYNEDEVSLDNKTIIVRMTVVTAFGTLNIMKDKLLIDQMFLLDMDSLRYRFMKNRDTSIRLYKPYCGADINSDVMPLDKGEKYNRTFVNIEKYDDALLPVGLMITECGLEFKDYNRCLGINLID